MCRSLCFARVFVSDSTPQSTFFSSPFRCVNRNRGDAVDLPRCRRLAVRDVRKGVGATRRRRCRSRRAALGLATFWPPSWWRARRSSHVPATLAIRLSTAGLNGHIYHVSPPKLALLLSRSSAYRFGVPAAFLAATNLLLGYAIPRLDPILYQTLFKAINVLATALFSTLRAPLGPTRWCSLVTLLVGSYLALGGGDDQGAATAIVGGHSSDAGSHGAASAHNPTRKHPEGLIATVAGALCMAMQGVWFEHESSASSAMQQDEGLLCRRPRSPCGACSSTSPCCFGIGARWLGIS